MDETTSRELGAAIHQEMWRARVTQETLGEALGIGQSAVSKKVRGKAPWTVDEAVIAADLLGTTVVGLLPRLDSNQQPADHLAQIRPFGLTNGPTFDQTGELAA